MADGKRRLDIISASPPQVKQGMFIPSNCYVGHSERSSALRYHLKGLVSLHKGYRAIDSDERITNFRNAFGLFHLALNIDSDYFCAREALSRTAGLLDLDDIEGGETYFNSITTKPTLGVSTVNESNGDYVCHLLDEGFYDSSELEGMLKEQI